MDYTRPNDKRARLAIIMIWVVLGAEILNRLSDLLEVILLQAIDRGDYVSATAINANDTRQLVIGSTFGAVYLASAIIFIMWMRRAYYNLEMRCNNMATTNGWAAGGWFVPIMSLFKPYQMMKEMFVETQNLLEKAIPDFPRRNQLVFVGWWWTVWIASNLISNVQFRMTLNTTTVDGILFGDYISIFLVVLDIPLAILAVRVIQEYSGMENLLATVSKNEATSGFEKQDGF